MPLNWSSRKTCPPEGEDVAVIDPAWGVREAGDRTAETVEIWQ